MLTGQKGKSKVVRDVEVAMAESQDSMIGKKSSGKVSWSEAGWETSMYSTKAACPASSP